MLLNPYRFVVALLNALFTEAGETITTEDGDVYTPTALAASAPILQFAMVKIAIL